ncbi:MAG: sensor domain-containing diguanylate cyclase [Candidatus Cohnella colombiensis]|uniref:Sensor domain-containing diguanylate cyclase n=1 Tax=Candidatus Cohnella colombiensis TaxID=3121368 RepID=A0AA95JA76_9BACL|nr:MAG: sensor domain-containing diguanylate cyclase [Cohnella sp.]
MITPYVPLIVSTLLLSVTANYLRFKGSEKFNKAVLVITSLLVVELEGLFFEFTSTDWTMLVFIGITTICFDMIGALISTSVAGCIMMLQTGESVLFVWLTYLIFATGVYLLHRYMKFKQQESDAWLSKLSTNSKLLNVYKEVSFSIQQSVQLQKLLQTILTAVTAGHGLGFNRAMILLVDEKGTHLNGVMGVGPMTAEEGFAVWKGIAKKKFKLVDLIQIAEKEITSDVLLNDRVKMLEIALDEPSFLSKVLETGSPLHLSNWDNSDQTLLHFVSEFNMSELAVFPLISQEAKVGVLIIDNPVNKKPITANDMDNVIPIAKQTAVAIQHRHFYMKIEDMAIKDGLTGLLNHRAFQTNLVQYIPYSREKTLSLILLDIDSFKHFNDTNGHLMGNEVLIQLAKIIQCLIQEPYQAFRFGGEEFVILLPQTSKEHAVRVAEQLRSNIERATFPCGEKQPLGRVTVSFGVASTEDMPSSGEFDLVDRADQALYKAKHAGKNRVVG